MRVRYPIDKQEKIMQFQIIIDTDNDAFQPSKTDEIARIFGLMPARILDSWAEEVGTKYLLTDYNGNAVGSFMRTK